MVKVTEKGTETRTGDMIQHRRLQVDARKWMLAKALPNIYGDKLTAEVTGKDGGPIETGYSPLELAAAWAFIFSTGMRAKERGKEAHEALSHLTVGPACPLCPRSKLVRIASRCFPEDWADLSK